MWANDSHRIGFAIKSLGYEKIILVVKEIGGSVTQRKYWDRYYSGMSAVIYVIDSAAPQDLIDESLVALATALASPEIADVPVLLIANKQDLPGALPANQVYLIAEYH